MTEASSAVSVVSEVTHRHEHFVQLYESDTHLIECIVGFISPGLNAGHNVLLVLTPEVKAALLQSLVASGYDVPFLVQREQVRILDAEGTLADFYHHGKLDRRRFLAKANSILKQATQPNRDLLIFGQMVALLLISGNHNAALELESLWNDLAQEHAFTLFCAYPAAGFNRAAHQAAFHEICRVHSHVVPTERFTSLRTEKERLTAVSILEQKARALEAEVESRLRAERELAAQLRDLARLHEANMRVSSVEDFQESLDVILEAFLEMENTDLGLLSMGSSDGKHLKIQSSVGFPPTFVERIGLVNAGDGACGLCFASKEQIIIEDTRVDPRFARYRNAAESGGFCSAHSIPLVNSQGVVVGVLSAHFRRPHRPSERQCKLADLYARDMAEIITRRKAEESVKLNERKLREADQKKDEFLAMLAHELRNPLAAISSSVTLLERPATKEADRVWVHGVLRRQVTQLARLLDDLLDVSRITRGKITLKREVLAFEDIVDRALQVVRPLFERQEHRFSLHPPDHACWVEGDAARLEQILVNLLTNAAKYTPVRGEISLSYERRERYIYVTVRDSGIGISDEMLPRLFELFSQDKQTLDRSQGGLGVGLSIVKQLVELHGGTVTATSEGAGKGSQFVVVLHAREKPAVFAPSAGQPAHERRRWEILVVDDNRDSALALSKLLTLEGHHTRVAHHGRDALAALSGFKPDIALLDLGLPEIDGYELARRIKAELGNRAPTIIAISGYGQVKDRARSAAAGFHYHFVKPVDHSKLLNLLDRVTKPEPPSTKEPSH